MLLVLFMNIACYKEKLIGNYKVKGPGIFIFILWKTPGKLLEFYNLLVVRTLVINVDVEMCMRTFRVSQLIIVCFVCDRQT
jgi:hypothetical protein